MEDLKKIVERLGQANNVLVTVSANPSVDQLAACIGLTLALNKLGKHTTAVFSGDIPDTIEFLKPEETIEKSADSLRDFIVSLDKAKADKLRYKVEDKVVKIFITPYRTSLSQDDLYFSQGDYNVDVVLTVGALEQRDLDQAITAHGRILHDATVVSMTNQKQKAQLGSLSWQDSRASSLSEMSARLVQQLGGKVMDGQIATAFLTGVVAETDRFRNAKTTADSMSLSADLMSAGANQQLITSQLDHQVDLRQPAKPADRQGGADNKGGDNPAGALQVSHDDDKAAVDDSGGAGDNNQAPEAPMAELPDVPPEADTAPKIHSVHANPDENKALESFHQDKYVDSVDAKPGFNSAPVFDGSEDGARDDEDDDADSAKSSKDRTLLSHDGSSADNDDSKLTDEPAPSEEPADLPATPASNGEAAKPEADNGAFDVPSAKPTSKPPAPAFPPEPPKPFEPPTAFTPPAPGPAAPAPSFSPPAPQSKPDYLPLNSEPQPKPQSATSFEPAAPAPAVANSPETNDANNTEPPKTGSSGHNQADIDAARSEVMKALSEQSSDNLPPLDSIGAQNLGEDLHAKPEPPQPAAPQPPTPPSSPAKVGQPAEPPVAPANQPLDMPMPPSPASPPAPSSGAAATPPAFGMPPAQPNPGNLPPAPPASGQSMSPAASPAAPPPVPPPMMPTNWPPR